MESHSVLWFFFSVIFFWWLGVIAFYHKFSSGQIIAGIMECPQGFKAFFLWFAARMLRVFKSLDSFGHHVRRRNDSSRQNRRPWQDAKEKAMFALRPILAQHSRKPRLEFVDDLEISKCIKIYKYHCSVFDRISSIFNVWIPGEDFSSLQSTRF